jgi:hypothetical protein
MGSRAPQRPPQQQDQYQEPQQEQQQQPPRDPVDMYLNKDEVFPDQTDEQPQQDEYAETQSNNRFDQQGIQRARKQDSQFIHKRIAAQEVLRWLKMSVLLLTMNIVVVFVLYLFAIMLLYLIVDIVIVAAVIFDGFYLMRMRKQQQYLQKKYNIQRQPSMLGGGFRRGAPQYRQQQRPQQRQQQTQQDFYDQGRRDM